jgi:hypothetical protein
MDLLDDDDDTDEQPQDNVPSGSLQPSPPSQVIPQQQQYPNQQSYGQRPTFGAPPPSQATQTIPPLQTTGNAFAPMTNTFRPPTIAPPPYSSSQQNLASGGSGSAPPRQQQSQPGHRQQIDVLASLVKAQTKLANDDDRRFYNHVKTCKHEKPCPYPACDAGKDRLLHYRGCRDAKCFHCMLARLISLKDRGKGDGSLERSVGAGRNELMESLKSVKKAAEEFAEAKRRGLDEDTIYKLESKLNHWKQLYTKARGNYEQNCEIIYENWSKEILPELINAMVSSSSSAAQVQAPTSQMLGPPPQQRPTTILESLQAPAVASTTSSSAGPGTTAPSATFVPGTIPSSANLTAPVSIAAASTAPMNAPTNVPRVAVSSSQPETTNALSNQPSITPSPASTPAAPAPKKSIPKPKDLSKNSEKAGSSSSPTPGANTTSKKSSSSAPASSTASSTPTTSQAAQPQAQSAAKRLGDEIEGNKVEYILGDSISAIISRLDRENEAITLCSTHKEDDWFTQRGLVIDANEREPSWTKHNILNKQDIESHPMRTGKRLFSQREQEFISRACQEMVVDLISECASVAKHRKLTSKDQNEVASKAEISLQDLQYVLQRHPRTSKALCPKPDLDGGVDTVLH